MSGLTLSFPWNESVATVHICIVALEKSVMQFYFSMSAKNQGHPIEYCSKPLKHSIVKRILVFK